ncbi:Wzz/FepE/Etk N-terminal domain-containing protein [Litorilituus lipolyticus]|uniref:Polysaccharide chain length determinant N-terminal domain-containing protein n=1 Tax=Litorilituus lipolyticus TaxID=2491017 RepID=A0A502LA89_9GAMM|nr:Wzz/FepE/Etk N-terminal domain-containing protein [Litorilituus lipolyticus]TPH18963.1 hypothetical protein EPA86_01315 [Litorilituus lipolyticus]
MNDITNTDNSRNKKHSQIMKARHSDHIEYEDDGIDIIALIINLKREWKKITLITVIGVTLSVFYALSVPKLYQSSVQLSLPEAASIVKLDQSGLIKYSKTELFTEYYNIIRSQDLFKSYLLSNNYLEKLYPESYTIEDLDKKFNEFYTNFRIEILEPKVSKDEFVTNPSLFSISLQHTNEALLLEVLNNYTSYSNSQLINNLEQDQKSQKILQLSIKQDEIDLLRENARSTRELLISKIESENTLTLNELHQQRELLISKATADRVSRIAQAEEAFAIAESLNIVSPTRLDNLNNKASKTTTSITLSENQSLPLYLMGTNYLSTLMKTLKAREDDAPFLIKVNEIESKIAKIKNDQKLKALKERESDDAYITSLPTVLNTIAQLKSKTIDFDNVKSYTLKKEAILTKKAIKPKRALIILLGGVISGVLALVIALFSLAVANRK